jgi:DNA repair exonuclease SbcCD ATPase subunit
MAKTFTMPATTLEVLLIVLTRLASQATRLYQYITARNVLLNAFKPYQAKRDALVKHVQTLLAPVEEEIKKLQSLDKLSKSDKSRLQELQAQQKQIVDEANADIQKINDEFKNIEISINEEAYSYIVELVKNSDADIFKVEQDTVCPECQKIYKKQTVALGDAEAVYKALEIL